MAIAEKNKLSPHGGGYLDGQFLVAMPGMKDDRFARSVIYVCAHNDEGAMGLIINQSQDLGFSDLLVQLGVIEERETIKMPASARDIIVRHGGPVDRSRGFVLHTDDYVVESSMQVDNEVCLTATVDILRAISTGGGPHRALMALGYAGWGAGQLEGEIAENGWLTCPADSDMLFDGDMDTKYERILAHIGVNLVHFSETAGHA